MTFTPTIVNAGPAGEQVLRLDVNGNHIDAHDGDLLVAPTGYYGFAYSDLGPYANGLAAYKASGGWISEAPRSLNFFTEVT